MIAIIVFASCSKDDEPETIYKVDLNGTNWVYKTNDQYYGISFADGNISYRKSIGTGSEWQSYQYSISGNNIKFVGYDAGTDDISGYLISLNEMKLVNRSTNKTVVLSKE